MHLICLWWHISFVSECLLYGMVFALGYISHQQETLNDQNKALADSERRVAEISTKKKRTEDKLSALQVDEARVDNQSGIEEAVAVQERLKLALEEKDVVKAKLEQQKEELWHELRQALAEREEAERRANKEMEGPQEEVQLY